MKNETKPTQEEKKQFLYQYYGQNVIVRTKGKYPYKEGEIVSWAAMATVSMDNVIAELTSLADITDEDLSRCMEIQWPMYVGRTVNLKWAKDILGAVCNSVHVYQYLQSRGYALTWRNYSVDQLISFGWLKLRQKGGNV